jgi:Ni,Fe-hydrogenase III large subunit
MQDKLGRIYRCKVCDPSLLNWPALRRAVCPPDEKTTRPETTLADFPLINKSFNLSYSGNDL